MHKEGYIAREGAGPDDSIMSPAELFYRGAAGRVDLPTRLQVVHYDKTRVSEGSRVRSQMAASGSYADGFLVLSAMKDEPWEPHWSPEVMVRHFVAAGGTLGRFCQEVAAGWWMAGEARKGRFDVLHAHHNTALIVALLWVMFSNKPLIFDSHDLFAPNQANRRSPVRRFCSWLKWGMLQRFVLSRALCGVHVSPGIVRIYRQLFPDTAHVLLWNLPAFAFSENAAVAENRESRIPDPDLEKRTILSPRPLSLVYFGLLTSERITLALIRTISSIPGVEFSLYGRIYDQADDFEEYSTAFHKLLREVPVRWHGTYTTAQLPGILEQMDMLVHPIPVVSENNKHAMPNKLFEACYSGKAVLYSSVFQDMDELASKYGFGCSFDPSDGPSATRAIEKLAADPQLVENMKENALRFVHEGPWSAAAYRNRLAEIYGKAAAFSICPSRVKISE